jgi:inosine-uridine nucleoside N-ribohydrolase
MSHTPPATIIFDTDMGPDADDAGALAVLLTLEHLGEARVLATIADTTNPWCAPAIDVINTYYGRGDIPVGTLKGPGSPGGSDDWFGGSFNGYLAGRFPAGLRHGTLAPDAIRLYRQVLAGQPTGSVTIVVVGPLTNLRDLLLSEPDDLSPMNGHQLVAEKVKELVAMGGQYPAGRESNFFVDAAATRTVVDEWPTPIMFSGFEIGQMIFTGPRLSTGTPPDNPVRVAYELWDRVFAQRFQPDFDLESGIWPHSSYDQTAVLYAVRGLGDYWEANRDGRNRVHEDGSNEWVPGPSSGHAYLVEKMPREEVARIIEDLMLMRFERGSTR